MPVRMNFGAGSVQPEGWVNVDNDVNVMSDWWDYKDAGAPLAGSWWIDAREGKFHSPDACGGGPGGFPSSWGESFDYVVANHSLSDLTFHELPSVLSELYRVLKPGGVLRVLVPDLEGAIRAWRERDGSWFPQGDDLESVDERFCTFVTWFGTVGSVFTPWYLYDLLKRAGFEFVADAYRGHTIAGHPPEIVSLDGDRTTSLIMEGRK